MRRKTRYYQGILAEYWVQFYLHIFAYRCLYRRYRTPIGEIDLIMRRGKQLVFIEVKQRKTQRASLMAVHRKNQQRVVKAAQWFLHAHPKLQHCQFRFDVVGVSWYGRISHIKHAFETIEHF